MATLIRPSGPVIVIRNGGRGAAGAGVAPGGTTGQSLVKSSDADFDTEWTTPAGGGDLLAANNLSDLANAATARTNLGLGNSATRNVGTTAGTVAAGNDSRLSDARTPTGTASGDLSGSYPSPTVTQARGLRETAGPTTLTLGAVADGEYLKRSGSTLVGDTPAGGGTTVDVQEFTSSGTWTKPANAVRVTAYLVGGGGGASSGTSNGATSQRGGAGGGAARTLQFHFMAAALGPTESVVVGAGGAGGAGVANSTFGNIGANGGSSSFAGAIAPGGSLGGNDGTGGGAGGNFAYGAFPFFQEVISGSAGGSATTSSAATGSDRSDLIVSTGGGAGGWINSGGTAQAGARGGNISTSRGIFDTASGGAGGAINAAGAAGVSKYNIGTGGGGGGASTTGNGGAGGAGAFPGGGGGGGGAALSGGALSGAGGNGGNGIVVIVTECTT